MNENKCKHNRGINNNSVLPCDGHITGILTSEEIKQYSLIKEDFNDKCLKSTSYDLRLGEGHYVYDGADKAWKPYWVGDPAEFDTANKLPPKFVLPSSARRLVIDPFGTALIQLKETIDTYTCAERGYVICGRFDLKLKMVIKGLISQQATQVEPYYIGKLFCYLFNQTGQSIILNYEDPIATIEFFYVSCSTYCDVSKRDLLKQQMEESVCKYRKGKSNEPTTYCNPYGINDVRYFWSEVDQERKLSDHGGLSFFYKKFGELQESVEARLTKLNPDILIEKTRSLLKPEIDSFKEANKWVTGIIIAAIAMVVSVLTLIFGGGYIVKLKTEGFDKKINEIMDMKRHEFRESLDKEMGLKKEALERKSEGGLIINELIFEQSLKTSGPEEIIKLIKTGK